MVQVLGSGAAALAAARVLAYHGIGARVTWHPMQSGPHLLLNRLTLRLLQDLFGCEAALLRQGSPIRGRLVSWERSSGTPDPVAEPGIAISANRLRRILIDVLRSGDTKDHVHVMEAEDRGLNADTIWTVDARGRGAGGPGTVMAIGERVAICGSVKLSTEADPSFSAVEAIEHGWLFLLPRGGGRATLQAVVPQRPECGFRSLGMLLAGSRLIGRLVVSLDHETCVLPCAPQFRQELARPAWLGAGEAALCLDPLCGDGTGQALRSGLLAGAVIRAVEQGEPQDACLAHYQHRLCRSMLAHLKATIAFYEIAPSPGVWYREIEMANQALYRLALGERVLGQARTPRYRLEGFSLARAY
jgi:hypothetical protein